MERYERDRLDTVELDRDLVAFVLLLFLSESFDVVEDFSLEAFFGGLRFGVVTDIISEGFFGVEIEFDSVEFCSLLLTSCACCLISLTDDSGFDSSFMLISPRSGIGLKP